MNVHASRGSPFGGELLFYSLRILLMFDNQEMLLLLKNCLLPVSSAYAEALAAHTDNPQSLSDKICPPKHINWIEDENAANQKCFHRQKMFHSAVAALNVVFAEQQIKSDSVNAFQML